MGSVSGSISLDMTKIEEAIQARVGEEVAKLVMPALAELSGQMIMLHRIVTAAHLNPGNAAATLASALRDTSAYGPNVDQAAKEQAELLAEMGYALVPVTPVTRLTTIATQPLPVPDGVDLGVEASRIAAQAQGPRGVDVEAAGAAARADARAAQNGHDPEEDFFTRADD
jgi:hypothetical protein